MAILTMRRGILAINAPNFSVKLDQLLQKSGGRLSPIIITGRQPFQSDTIVLWHKADANPHYIIHNQSAIGPFTAFS
jgi:hypothetical protein